MHDYVIVDVFTNQALAGNPAAVVLDAADLDGERMQAIAREMNLSETVFVLPPEDGGDVRVRIFTPANELPFAGHPTLGAAVVLADGRDALGMETGMGMVPFTYDRGGDGPLAVSMRQPVPTWERYDREAELLAALGVAKSWLPVDVYRNGPRHVYVALPDVATLSALRPDQRALAEHPDLGVNCFAADGDTWRLRMFAPAYGVAEDPATGSAAGPLAVHLARHGRIPFGERIEIRQGIEIGRPSVLFATAAGTPERVDRVEVAGSAVVVARGQLLV